jgi:rod shape-determining protein MreC
VQFIELLKYYRLKFLGSRHQFIEKRSIQPLFTQGRASSLKTVFLCLVSLALMTADHRFDHLKIARSYLSLVVYPFEYMVNFPIKAGQWLSTNLATQYHLVQENTKLHEENLFLRVSLQRLDDLYSENSRLRELLGSSKKVGERVSVAEVLAVDLDPDARKIRINKGSQHGVFEGQPLVDAQGVMGQVIHVSLFSSVVMLITDPNHALPLQFVRTGLRAIAVGLGTINQLDLLYLPNNAPITIGDLLVTSGFGEKFPMGYPVGKVVEFKTDVGQPYAQVRVEPSARLERNREVLLIWVTQDESPIDSPNGNESEVIPTKTDSK